jgi:nicotinamide-nucleotide amidase
MAMVNDDLLKLSAELGTALKSRGWTLALAESCTGGWAAECITAIAGSSAWFDRGFITYSNAAKIEMLGVTENTLSQHGAVSEQTAREMALGALKHSHASIAAAITGIAGPDGGTQEKPVGTVCFAWATANGDIKTVTRHLSGDREEVRRISVKTVLEVLLQLTLNGDL